ncbi:F-box protein [Candidatus Odyssella thessalonicensis]|uniref:F-box protein n=1 Tax=Candidatus Odyssella thessalonicensis TaxID=84647 RepID=UPI000225C0C1|nr:F-box protein [Candidatus Odyssella thessalonicensis]
MSKLSRLLLATLLAVPPLMAMELEEDRNTSDQNIGWNNLVTELQAHLIGQLDGRDTVRVGLVSKELYTLANDDIAWKQRVNQNFPNYHGEPPAGESWKGIYKAIKKLHDDYKQYFVMHPEIHIFVMTPEISALPSIWKRSFLSESNQFSSMIKILFHYHPV